MDIHSLFMVHYKEVVMSNNKKRFPLFHVPHDGTSFPEELMESVCIPKEQFLSYHERMRDTGV